jgi:hypothetical protein
MKRITLIVVGLTLASISHAVTSQYWHVSRISDGKVRIICTNGGDATIEPTAQEHSIIVSCGTR